jgi:hypothetical protein
VLTAHFLVGLRILLKPATSCDASKATTGNAPNSPRTTAASYRSVLGNGISVVNFIERVLVQIANMLPSLCRP